MIWDPTQTALYGWFFSWNQTFWKFEGANRIAPGEPSPPYPANYTPPILEPPALPALNRPTTIDSTFTEFRCLDRSNYVMRRFGIDFKNRELDELAPDSIDPADGLPRDAVYIEQPDSGRMGYTWFREGTQAWDWFSPTGTASPPYMNENHTLNYGYGPGSTTPVWHDGAGVWFSLYQANNGALLTFSVGFDMEGETPTIEGRAPIGVGNYFMDEDWTTTHAVNGPPLIGTLKNDNAHPIALDQEGRLWLGTPSPGFLLLIQDGIAPNRGLDDPARHIRVNVPTGFISDRAVPLYIDASLNGYLTIVWNGGVETFQITQE